MAYRISALVFVCSAVLAFPLPLAAVEAMPAPELEALQGTLAPQSPTQGRAPSDNPAAEAGSAAAPPAEAGSAALPAEAGSAEALPAVAPSAESGEAALTAASDWPAPAPEQGYLEPLLDAAPAVRLSGWLDVAYKNRTTQGSDAFIDVHHVYWIVDAQLSDTWRAFSELEYEHAPFFSEPSLDPDSQTVSGGIGDLKLERAYVEGNFARQFALRVGKFNTPLGIRVPAHWLILTPLLAKPIHEDNAYVPVKSVGASVFGWLQVAGQELGYTAFLSNGSEVFGTNKPGDGITGLGGDLNLRIADQLLLGGSYYQQKNPTELDRVERSLLAYLELDWFSGNLLLRGELFRQFRGEDAVTTVSSGYGLVRYRMHFYEPLAVAYRLDSGTDAKRGAGGGHVAHSVNLSYQPEPYLKWAVEANAHSFELPEAADYQELTLWVGVAF